MSKTAFKLIRKSVKNIRRRNKSTKAENTNRDKRNAAAQRQIRKDAEKSIQNDLRSPDVEVRSTAAREYFKLHGEWPPEPKRRTTRKPVEFTGSRAQATMPRKPSRPTRPTWDEFRATRPASAPTGPYGDVDDAGDEDMYGIVTVNADGLEDWSRLSGPQQQARMRRAGLCGSRNTRDKHPCRNTARGPRCAAGHRTINHPNGAE